MGKTKVVCIFIVLAFSLTLVSHVGARPSKRFDATTGTCRVLNKGELDWDSLAWGMGGKGFQRVCKSCHFRGNDKGATFLYTESKTSRGWNKVFAKKRVECAKDGSWDSLTSEEILKINDYLYRFANDSWDRCDGY